MNRRKFLQSLGIGLAALQLRLRPEPTPHLIASIMYDIGTDRFKTYRRSVFYTYPNGNASLVGLLTLLKDDLNNEPIQWFETPSEKRPLSA